MNTSEKKVRIISKVVDNGVILLEAIAVEGQDEYEPRLLISDGLACNMDEEVHLNGKIYVAASPKYYPYRPYLFDERISYRFPSTQEVFDRVLE
ncbi:MAG: hypothetical protein J7K49_05320, partial [Thaumarchaeota archaeon]|nr:hypothetical protein [Nitrososphaerota archaeon]